MKKPYLLGAIAAIIIVVAVGYFFRYKPPQENYSVETSQTAATQQANELSDNQIKMNIITIKTNFGEIQFETYDTDAPKTVQNFITLAEKGFYDGLTFHRVIKGFMIQGGDPNGNGAGGPGYQFEDELNPNTESYKAGYKKGVVAMANAGPNTNGSQFFIMLEDYPLPNNYTIFGKVIKGQETVDAIGSVQIGVNDKPLKPVIMEKVTVTKNQ
ncbi:MAG: peptidylprolyl isomerase [Candidatus Tagabacteria bacterium]